MTEQNPSETETEIGTDVDYESILPEDAGGIAHWETIPATDGDHYRADSALPPTLAESLPFESLFTHQARGLQVLANGENLCVSTPTASGKTLIYALHIARSVISNSDATALLIYPTKALSRDQQNELTDLYQSLGLDIDVRVYDGDVNADTKEEVRNESDVIITNFAGLNTYLPHHELWDSFFSNLETVVIDESHSYTGILGMHAAWITRRLDRIAHHYGQSPQFVCTSATIGNPKEHSEQLIGHDVTVVDEDTSPHGKRELFFMGGPRADIEDDSSEADTNATGAYQGASAVATSLAANDFQSLLFADSRKLTELTAMWARREAGEYDTHLAIEAYNAGLRKQDRRRIESRLKDGEVDAVTTTSALEMGINVGSVDGIVLAGYPGTRQSFWQRLGRAGRDNTTALGVYVPRNTQLDQYIVENPEHVLSDPVEDAVIDLENNNVYARHVRVAARELPLTQDDQQWFGQRLPYLVEMFKDGGEFAGALDQTGVRYLEGGSPELSIDIYAASKDTYKIMIREGGDVWSLPNADATRAYREFHPGAIHLHQGQRYEVVDFDQANREIVLEPTDADYYTEVNREVVIEEIETTDRRQLVDGIVLNYGTVQVKEFFPTFTKRDLITDEEKNTVETELNIPATMQTSALWLTVSRETQQQITDRLMFRPDGINSELVTGGVRAIGQAMVNLAPVELLVDPADLGVGVNTAHGPENNNVALYIYDGAPGGVGFANRIHDTFTDLADRTHQRLANCSCGSKEGCPACVLSSTDGNGAEMSKTGALELLSLLN